MHKKDLSPSTPVQKETWYLFSVDLKNPKFVILIELLSAAAHAVSFIKVHFVS
jgi:hypothetical protein